MLEGVLGELQDGEEEPEVPVLGSCVDVDGRHDDRGRQSETDEREADGGAALAAAAPAAGAAAATAPLTHRCKDNPRNQGMM